MEATSVDSISFSVGLAAWISDGAAATTKPGRSRWPRNLP